MPKPKFKVVKTSQTITHMGVITRSDLRKQFNIPDNADIYVEVPSGADWSGMALDIDDTENAICVRWTEVK